MRWRCYLGNLAEKLGGINDPDYVFDSDVSVFFNVRLFTEDLNEWLVVGAELGGSKLTWRMS